MRTHDDHPNSAQHPNPEEEATATETHAEPAAAASAIATELETSTTAAPEPLPPGFEETAAPPAASEPAIANEAELETAAPAAEPETVSDEEPAPLPQGFRHFRHWTNRRIQSLGGHAQLLFAGDLREVEELTNDGQLRLRIEPREEGQEASFANVPLDDRFIERLLIQLIPIG